MHQNITVSNLQNMCSHHLYVRPAQLLLEAGLLVPTPPPKPDIRSPKSNTDQDSGYGRYGESPRSSKLGSRLEVIITMRKITVMGAIVYGYEPSYERVELEDFCGTHIRPMIR